MTKRAHKLKVAARPGAKVRRKLVNSESQTLQNSQQGAELRELSESRVGTQVYSSAEQALEVLVEGIVGKLGDSPREQLEMAEFFNMLLDTDPALRDEVLANTTIRK